MKLLGTNEVCELLGISKATLYRWNGLTEDTFTTLKQFNKQNKQPKADSFLSKIREMEDSVPKNFPRPFKIGRAYKWDRDEIIEWVETMRLKK